MSEEASFVDVGLFSYDLILSPLVLYLLFGNQDMFSAFKSLLELSDPVKCLVTSVIK